MKKAIVFAILAAILIIGAVSAALPSDIKIVGTVGDIAVVDGKTRFTLKVIYGNDAGAVVMPLFVAYNRLLEVKPGDVVTVTGKIAVPPAGYTFRINAVKVKEGNWIE